MTENHQIALALILRGTISKPEQVEIVPTIESTPGLPEEPKMELECAVSTGFPNKVRRWCDLITENTRDFKIDPDLVAAVIYVESGGNPKAYSKSGAVGLMQIMPRDGIAAGFMCASGPCFRNRPTIAKLKNPEFNIKYGTRMLARLVKKYGVREGLKRYGPMNYGYKYADLVLATRDRYAK